MKLLFAILFFSVLSTQALGQAYTLSFEKRCSSRNMELSFKCRNDGFTTNTMEIFQRDGAWFGKEPPLEDIFPLRMIKHDSYVTVFDYPVRYSGLATIVLVHPTNRFFFTEAAYSSTLGVQSYDVESGRFRGR